MLSKIINTFEDSKKNISIDNRIWRFKVAKLGAEEETGHDRDCVQCGHGVEECVAGLLQFTNQELGWVRYSESDINIRDIFVFRHQIQSCTYDMYFSLSVGTRRVVGLSVCALQSSAT